MRKAKANVTIEGDAETILAFCQRNPGVKVVRAIVNDLVRHESNPRAWEEFSFYGTQDGNSDQAVTNVARIEKQGRIDREQADELCRLLQAFSQLQK
jgi:hypothetical protein